MDITALETVTKHSNGSFPSQHAASIFFQNFSQLVSPTSEKKAALQQKKAQPQDIIQIHVKNKTSSRCPPLLYESREIMEPTDFLPLVDENNPLKNIQQESFDKQS